MIRKDMIDEGDNSKELNFNSILVHNNINVDQVHTRKRSVVLAIIYRYLTLNFP